PSEPLSYAEGGPALQDPGASAPAARYVDADGGDDGADGLTPATAWQSLGKVHDESTGLPAGVHVLLRRGRSWGGSLTLDPPLSAADGARFVVGAYGPLAEPRPQLDSGGVRLRGVAWVTVRDLDAERISATDEAHHNLIYDNVVHAITSGDLNNGIVIGNLAHHNAVVDNLVYDIHANDGISIHDKNWGDPMQPVGDSQWIADNVVVGNSGMEEPIDFASGHGLGEAKDVKIVGNRAQCEAIAGTSTLSGRAGSGIVVGHEGSHVWIVGNIVSGCNNRGIGTNASAEDSHVHMHISGNVVFNNGVASNVNVDLEMSELTFRHNTVVHDLHDRNPVAMREFARRMTFERNIVANEEHTTWGGWVSVSPTPSVAIAAMDHNWYADLSGDAPHAIVGGLSLSEWQSTTGFDPNSGDDPISGLSVPGSSWLDPRQWNEPAFLAHFVPDSGWPACQGDDTPGAFDCDGNRLGIVFEPHADLDNDGYGWEGPLIMQQRYPMRCGR
ncbi:MAG: right-handed parallel beta-helix repeat-containing protein, partial [Deltaproteobacteria bacterium]|nr:right-handed parallel beta-helix repeat-containing protein [Deltaproteobacteria bacterium]MBW2531148.1 right-handed parallel beta-helix repeat-containing protein [Deltaproteobacteria bacterium]